MLLFLLFLSVEYCNISASEMGDPLPPLTQCESFIFLDLESTGLPFQEIGKARVTELSMISVRREDMKKTDGKIPRVLHKLTMSFNPQKIISEEVTNITGEYHLFYLVTFCDSNAVRLKYMLMR